VTHSTLARFPLEVRPTISELLPLCRALGEGKYAVSLGGSYGKGTSDRRSDLDFRLFCERRAAVSAARRALNEAIDRWAERGIIIDGCWVRTVAEIESQLDRWISGEGSAPDLVWTIWGYHIVTDIYNQAVVEDPHGILADWRQRLSSYPPNLKAAVLKRHLASLHYWRDDYHYASKVRRQDLVFLAGITSKLVHDLLQVLYALNETYYPGDGKNLHFADRFAIAPPNLRGRIEGLLYPGRGDNAVAAQRDQLFALIDDVLALTTPE